MKNFKYNYLYILMFISIGSYANKPSMGSGTELPTNQTHSKNIEHKPVDQSLENLQAFDTSNLAFLIQVHFLVKVIEILIWIALKSKIGLLKELILFN
jgi:hypothetical protein